MAETQRQRGTSWMNRNGLLFGTIAGVVLGTCLGFGLRQIPSLPGELIQLISYPGEIFTRALQMMILPLVMSSLLVGSASLNAKTNGKIAARTLTYFIITSFFNAILGIVLVLVIHPGETSLTNSDAQHVGKAHGLEKRPNTLLDNFLDLGRNIVPNNIFTALFEQTQTVYEPSATNETNFIRTVVVRPGTNTLGVITFALLFGMILGTLGERASALIESFRLIDIVIMKMILGVMWITPVGVGSIIANKILTVDDLTVVTSQLGLFILTVVIGVLLYQLIILQLIYFVVLRKNPFRFYAGLMQSTITAFATASAAVALPITFRCMENLHVDRRITQFVLPIGVTINKDGTALFVAIASIFIAQLNGHSLDFGQLVTVAITSTAVSIASASIPSASLALMFIVLNAIGVPTQDIGLLFAVDWLVDRARTTNNQLGDCYAAVIVEHFSQAELRLMDNNDNELKVQELSAGSAPRPPQFTRMGGESIELGIPQEMSSNGFHRTWPTNSEQPRRYIRNGQPNPHGNH